MGSGGPVIPKARSLPAGFADRTLSWRTSPTPQVTCTVRTIHLSLVIEPLDKTWCRFFPGIPKSRINSYIYPWPGTPDFWLRYGEPLEVFVQLVHLYSISSELDEVERGELGVLQRILSTVQKRPGKWRARVSLGWRKGRRVRKSFTAATRGEVQHKLTKALRDCHLGFNVAPEKRTLGQWLHEWLEHHVKPSVRPKTYTFYECIIRNWITPHLGQIPVQKLTPTKIQELLSDRRAAGLAPGPSDTSTAL